MLASVEISVWACNNRLFLCMHLFKGHASGYDFGFLSHLSTLVLTTYGGIFSIIKLLSSQISLINLLIN